MKGNKCNGKFPEKGGDILIYSNLGNMTCMPGSNLVKMKWFISIHLFSNQLFATIKQFGSDYRLYVIPALLIGETPSNTI